MKKQISFTIAIILQAICFQTIQAQYNYEWAKNSNGTSFDRSTCVTTDNSGNVFIAGYYDWASLVIGSSSTPYVQYNDAYIAKFDSTGSLAWLKAGTGNGHQMSNDLSTDASGNIYMAGSFYGDNLTFDNIVYSDTNAYLVKYNGSGNVQWVKYASSGYSSCVVNDISGNVYVAGNYYGTMNLGNNVFSSNNGSVDIFIAKLDGNGNIIWAKTYGGNGNDYVNDIIINNKGEMFYCGSFSGTNIAFGTTTLINSGGSSMSGNYSDLFFVKSDLSGNVVWAKKSGKNLGNEEGYGIACDLQGNLYIVGEYSSDSTYFDNIKLVNAGGTNMIGTKYADAFIAKTDSAGTFLWAKSAGGTSRDQALAVAIDTNLSELYVTGSFNSTSITFDTCTLQNPQGGTDYAKDDIFLTKFGLNGNLIYAKKTGGTGCDAGSDVVCDKNSNVYLAGYFNSLSIAFDTITINIGNGTGDDLFLAKIKAIDFTLSVTPSTHNVSNLAGNVSYSITSNTSWTANSDQLWCTLNPSNGSGNGNITATYTNNSNSYQRTANITINGTGIATQTVTLTQAGAVNINEIDNNDMQIFPNPVADKLFMELNNRSMNPGYAYVYNALGELVFTSGISGSKQPELDFSNLTEGIYYLKIHLNDGVITKKIIKVK